MRANIHFGDRDLIIQRARHEEHLSPGRRDPRPTKSGDLGQAGPRRRRQRDNRRRYSPRRRGVSSARESASFASWRSSVRSRYAPLVKALETGPFCCQESRRRRLESASCQQHCNGEPLSLRRSPDVLGHTSERGSRAGAYGRCGLYKSDPSSHGIPGGPCGAPSSSPVLPYTIGPLPNPVLSIRANRYEGCTSTGHAPPYDAPSGTGMCIGRRPGGQRAESCSAATAPRAAPETKRIARRREVHAHADTLEATYARERVPLFQSTGMPATLATWRLLMPEQRPWRRRASCRRGPRRGRAR